VSICLTVKAEV